MKCVVSQPCAQRSQSTISQCVIFFFQAEDGIRDLTVTGVQTCALPISNEIIKLGTGAVEIKSGYGLTLRDELKMLRVAKRIGAESPLTVRTTFLGAHEIGRASCRERV